MRRVAEALRRAALWQGGLPLVWIALTVVELIPVWHQRMLPMLDTPNHLALVRGWHSYHDPAFHIPDYYDLRIRYVPYFLFYWSINQLMNWVSIETANKIFLSVYLVLFPLAVLYLASAFRRSPWLAIGGFALAYNQNWIYGFSSFLMGVTMFLFAVGGLIWYLRDGRQSALAMVLGASLVAYLAHVMPWVIFGLCAGGLLILHWRRWRRWPQAIGAMLPSLLLAVTAFFEERSEKAYMNRGDTFSGTFRDVPTALAEFPRRIMELFPGYFDYGVLAVIALTVIVLACVRGTHHEDGDPQEEKQMAVVLTILGLLYLSLPYSMGKPMSWWNISPRLPSMMAPFLLLLPVGPLRGWWRAAVVPMAIACVALPLKLTQLYGDFSRRNEPFMQLVEELPTGTPAMVVVRDMLFSNHPEESSGDPSSAGPVYWHFPSWPMALKGGYGAYIFDQGIPIRPRKDLKPIPAPHWGGWAGFTIELAPTYDYFLIRNPTPTQLYQLDTIDKRGDWALLKRPAEKREGEP